MKHCIILFLSAVVFFCFSVEVEALSEISAESFVLMCADTKELISSKNAEEQKTIASTTKILTAVVAIESGMLKETVTVGDEITGVDGTSLGLEIGDTIDLYSLVLATLLSSGNDGANAIAVFVGGSTDNFAEMMNEKARQIGMKNSSFVTPSGLDADEHYSTAVDMALLACYAMNIPVFREMVGMQSARIEFTNGKVLYVNNHNKLLSMYDGCIGIKTGFTKSSGRCLVSAAQKDGSLLIAVTLNAPDDWNDHIKLYDYGFETVRQYEAEVPMLPEINVVGAKQKTVSCRLSSSLTYTAVDKAADFSIEISVPAFVYAPLTENDVLGEVKLLADGRVLARAALLADESIDKAENIEEKNTVFYKIKNILTGWFAKWKN